MMPYGVPTAKATKESFFLLLYNKLIDLPGQRYKARPIMYKNDPRPSRPQRWARTGRPTRATCMENLATRPNLTGVYSQGRHGVAD